MTFTKLFAAFLILFLFLSCKNPCEICKDEIYSEDISLKSSDSNRVKRIKFFFRILDEPSLDSLDHESYRLIYQQIFVDTSHLIRIGNTNSRYYLIQKKFIKDSDSTFKVVETIEKTLTPDEWNTLNKLIYKTHYWTLPKEIHRMGLDGGSWTVEGRRPEAANCGKRPYHLVSRWSPERGDFSNLCDKFDELAGNEPSCR